MPKFRIEPKGSLKTSSLRALAAPASEQGCHGILHEDYDRANSSKTLMRVLIANSDKYSVNFDYKIENERQSSMDLSIAPHAHLEEFPYRSEALGSFICDYHKEYFTRFSAYQGRTPVVIDEAQCHFKGADRCVYRLKIAN